MLLGKKVFHLNMIKINIGKILVTLASDSLLAKYKFKEGKSNTKFTEQQFPFILLSHKNEKEE